MTSSVSIAGYTPCTESDEWYISHKTIRCNNEYRRHGYAPDAKDCSKYYKCSSEIDRTDNMSTGWLQSCLAGLWWDQSRKMCVMPNEVPCDPYQIINNMGLLQQMDEKTRTDEKMTEKKKENRLDYTWTNWSKLKREKSLMNKKCSLHSCSSVGLSSYRPMRSILTNPRYFYKCDGQCAALMRCPNNLVFDDDLQRCEWFLFTKRGATLRRKILKANGRMAFHFFNETKKERSERDVESIDEFKSILNKYTTFDGFLTSKNECKCRIEDLTSVTKSLYLSTVAMDHIVGNSSISK
ncbi:hypothetical protein SNEBB_002208 [Seison nebaliae]|nr:hypothetical protein SNEBB_002208 [Seison nebaliae]